MQKTLRLSEAAVDNCLDLLISLQDKVKNLEVKVASIEAENKILKEILKCQK